MARRSSARLRERLSSTPKRASLSHDAQPKTPRTAPVRLASLHESDEIPGAFPRSVSPQAPDTSTAKLSGSIAAKVPVKFGTPEMTTPIRPAEEEMHPQKHHQSTAKPFEEARWLGFSNMIPQTEPSKRSNTFAPWLGTPTRTSNTQAEPETPRFKFTFRREQSLELSPEAKKLMLEKRGEAAKIREQMGANGEGTKSEAASPVRKIAMPKGKKGRFSQVHMEQFKNMVSIAGHASAFRADPNRAKAAVSANKASGTADASKASEPATKSLKRSPSKAQLDDIDKDESRAPPRATLHSRMHAGASSKQQHPSTAAIESSPNKRAKRTDSEEATVKYPDLSEQISEGAKTPQPNKAGEQITTCSNVTSLASPTQASLARAVSTKGNSSTRIPAPSLPKSPSRTNVAGSHFAISKHDTGSLLARSPSKLGIGLTAVGKSTESQASPLLQRSPSRAPAVKVRPEVQMADGQQAQQSTPFLSRSPLKMAATKTPALGEDLSPGKDQPQLLARTPVKIAGIKSALGESKAEGEKTKAPSVPLLARPPSKIAMPVDPDVKNDYEQPNSPTRTLAGGLLGRFNMLRPSPVKSILRSPQRLYSDDPTKIAAGTHLATPPKGPAFAKTAPKSLLPTATPSQKRVDFTSSTKARYERAQSEAASTPSKTPSPATSKPALTKSGASSGPAMAAYPSLPNEQPETFLTPQKRRQTATPADFTFRAGTQEIIFSPSPHAIRAGISPSRTSTIRHVSAEPLQAPQTGSKKRKFDFENDKAIYAAESSKGKNLFSDMSDKENLGKSEPENDDDDAASRPAKRARAGSFNTAPAGAATSQKQQEQVKKTTRVPTLGVKPKGVKAVVKDGAPARKPNTISMSRLNALAQPKKRG